MGFCVECKKQTDIYCLHHKKHVCIDCLTKLHTKCTAKKYREFVENGGKEQNECDVCKNILEEGNIIRLPCLCVFHKECLITYFDNHQDNVICPQCQSEVFTETKIKECNTQMKDELIDTFKGKNYTCSAIQSNIIKEEELDENTQMLLDNENEKEESIKHEENISFVHSEMTSLKRKEDEIEVPIEVGPRIAFDISSDDEEDHGSKKKNQQSLGEDFVKSLRQKGKISPKTIVLLFCLMIILIIFMIIIFLNDNTDT